MSFFQLPQLPFAYDALEPYFDSQTMELHHTKHHGGYVAKLNAALAKLHHAPEDLQVLLRQVGQYPLAVRNNAGGHYNHAFLWESLAPAKSTSQPIEPLAEALKRKFGNLEGFTDHFASAAASLFGAGWTWLLVDGLGDLQITTTPNQDNPLMDVATIQGTPLLGLDLWEHAYYLRYEHRRPDYIAAFWKLVNWERVNERYEACQQ